MTADDRSIAARAERIAEAALRRGVVIAVAESLTGGAVAQALARASQAQAWFAGGVVAYRAGSKHRALGVPPGPVVTAATARAMAAGVCTLLAADLAVATTGVGGPDAAEGHPAGTVFLGVASASGASARGPLHFPGEPTEVVVATVDAVLDLLEESLDAVNPLPGGPTSP